jgi:tetratricopeptide (TPR) repeat protein
MLKLLLPFIDRAPIDVQGTVLYSAGGLAFMIGDWPWGIEVMRASADVNARAGNSMRHSMSLTYLGACRWGQGDLDGALDALERALAVARDAHDIRALTRGLMIRTWLETELDLDRAESLALETEREAVTLENVFDLGHCREVQGYIQCLKGEVEQGARVLASALAIFNNIQTNCGSHVLETAAAWAVIAGRFELGAEFLGSALRIREETGDRPRPWEHSVQETWLPKIRVSLDPDLFHAALRRGRQRAWADALDFAGSELRAAAG